jgi:two-component system, NtrC family, nitrogen regulation sensor histidine kinase NtrY
MRLAFDRRLQLVVLVAGLPGCVATGFLLWWGDYSSATGWLVMGLLAAIWLGAAVAMREKLVFTLQTLSNLLAALREGDYSIRARGARGHDALAEVFREVNGLAEFLKDQRLDALEATALLRVVMAEIVDVAVFAFDNQRVLRLVNRAGEDLLGQSSARLLGRSAADLSLDDCLAGEPARTIQLNFPGGAGRWGMRRGAFREGGVPHQLLVLTNLNRALREEERQAWQRLVRVLGHELNNSLAPIKSIAGSLEKLVRRDPLPADWKEDMQGGLNIIGTRAESLTRFVEAYAKVARLPQPRLGQVAVEPLVQQVAGLETRLKIAVEPGPDFTLQADRDQLEQLLINLLRNAVDAVLETLAAQSPAPATEAARSAQSPGVKIGWRLMPRQLEIWIEDDGPGLANTTNLFVPFFTTKKSGSGIGLVLCRQIAEAHNGTLTLQNRAGQQGCLASLRLPR